MYTLLKGLKLFEWTLMVCGETIHFPLSSTKEKSKQTCLFKGHYFNKMTEQRHWGQIVISQQFQWQELSLANKRTGLNCIFESSLKQLLDQTLRVNII